MSDLALKWDGTSADCAIEANDLARDDGLETAVLVSLFTDRRVETDELPDGQTDQRGWWADALSEDGDQIGSKLWLLDRETERAAVLPLAQGYAKEALQWMIDDGVAERIDVATEFTRPRMIGMEIVIHRPKSRSVSFQFDLNWAAQEARI